MKILKNGFSLAELLVAMGIIAIIAAMGFVISKQGIENAYNRYLYTGYSGIYEAIAATNASGMSPIVVTNGNPPVINERYIRNIAKLLDATFAPNSVETFTAPNQISYTISLNPNQINGNSVIDITMTVPTAKRKGALDNTRLLYLRGIEGGLLVPRAPGQQEQFINLQERMDLLPFYIDNGEGGNIVDMNNNAQFVRRTFYSFREAYCRRYGNVNLVLSDGTTIINCAGIGAANAGEDRGTIQYENPHKVF